VRSARVPAIGQRDFGGGKPKARFRAKLGRDAEPFQPARPRGALRAERRARREVAAPHPPRGLESGAPASARRRVGNREVEPLDRHAERDGARRRFPERQTDRPLPKRTGRELGGAKSRAERPARPRERGRVGRQSRRAEEGRVIEPGRESRRAASRLATAESRFRGALQGGGAERRGRSVDQLERGPGRARRRELRDRGERDHGPERAPHGATAIATAARRGPSPAREAASSRTT
jgi:hypothetical protein